MRTSRLIRFLVILTCSLSSLVAHAQVEKLYGSWRLVSWTKTVVETGESEAMYGKAPHGFLTYGRDGRMSVMVVKENRVKPTDLSNIPDRDKIDLFDSMFWYSGTFTIEGSKVVHSIDISWNEHVTGTAQVRNFRIEGNTLTIHTDPIVSPVDGKVSTAILIWEK